VKNLLNELKQTGSAKSDLKGHDTLTLFWKKKVEERPLE